MARHVLIPLLLMFKFFEDSAADFFLKPPPTDPEYAADLGHNPVYFLYHDFAIS